MVVERAGRRRSETVFDDGSGNIVYWKKIPVFNGPGRRQLTSNGVIGAELLEKVVKKCVEAEEAAKLTQVIERGLVAISELLDLGGLIKSDGEIVFTGLERIQIPKLVITIGTEGFYMTSIGELNKTFGDQVLNGGLGFLPESYSAQPLFIAKEASKKLEYVVSPPRAIRFTLGDGTNKYIDAFSLRLMNLTKKFIADERLGKPINSVGPGTIANGILIEIANKSGKGRIN